MQRRQLGDSGLSVSVLGLGTMNFGTQLDEAQSHRILDEALDHGINLIDTAEMYASPPTAETYGRSEQIVGSWLKGRRRDEIVLATKMVGPTLPHFPTNWIRGGQTRISARWVAEAVDASLQRLGTDHIDLFYLHWPDHQTPFGEQVAAMDAVISAGKIRHFATSNEGAWGLMRLIAAAERSGRPKPVCVQNELSLVRPGARSAVEEVCLKEKLGFIGFSPLAMGLLSGKYLAGNLPAGSRFERYERYRNAYFNPAGLAKAERMAERARAAGISLATAAYWWALTRPAVSAILTSVSNPQQFADAVRAAGLSASGRPDFLEEE
jgi:aryl-alcohol dehydrogenase-like predicted oxidoreductase